MTQEISKLIDKYLPAYGVGTEREEIRMQMHNEISMLIKNSLTPNLSTCYSLGTKLLLNSNELQDEEVVVLDLTSSGCPYVCGENFEGFVPQLTNK
jgi:hypothetical protein